MNKKVKIKNKLTLIFCAVIIFSNIFSRYALAGEIATDKDSGIKVEISYEGDDKTINVKLNNKSQSTYKNIYANINISNKSKTIKTKLKQNSLKPSQIVVDKININNLSKKGILDDKNKLTLITIGVIIVIVLVLIVIFYKSKKAKKIITFLIGISIIEGLLVPININAEDYNKSFTVKKKLIINEVSYNCTINVKYEGVKESEYKINDSDREALNALIGELYYINELDGYKDYPNVNEIYKVNNTKNGIPNDDKGKIALMEMLIYEHMDITKAIVDNVNQSPYYISTNKINSFLKQAIGSSVKKFDNIDGYELVNNEICFPSGNRGSDNPVVSISSLTQTSGNKVIIKGDVGHYKDLAVEDIGRFEAEAVINKKSMFGGLTIKKFNTDVKSLSEQDYIFKDINTRFLSYYELKNLDVNTLAYARNEIYARHGYVFKEDMFRSYFKDRSWYKENPDFNASDDSQLNKYEKANRDLICKVEQEKNSKYIPISSPMDGSYSYFEYNKHNVPKYQLALAIKKESDSKVLLTIASGMIYGDHIENGTVVKKLEDFNQEEANTYCQHRVSEWCGEFENVSEDTWEGKLFEGCYMDLNNPLDNERVSEEIGNYKLQYNNGKIFLECPLGKYTLEKQSNSLEIYDCFIVHP